MALLLSLLLLTPLAAPAKEEAAVLHQRGQALAREGRFEESAELLQAATKLRPGGWSTKLVLGSVLRAARRTREAVALFKEAASIKPHWRVSMQLGFTHMEGVHNKKRLKQAEQAFARATRQNPLHAEAYQELGTVQQQRKKRKASLRSFSESLRLQPSSADAHFNLALSAYKLASSLGTGALASALPEVAAGLQSALQLDPELEQRHKGADNPIKHLVDAVARGLQQNDRLDEAHIITKLATRLSSGDAGAEAEKYFSAAASLAMEKQSHSLAVEAFKRGLLLRPSSINGHMNLAHVLFAMATTADRNRPLGDSMVRERYAEAERHYRAALHFLTYERVPSHASLAGPSGEPVLWWGSALVGLGDCLQRQTGRVVEAMEVYERGVRLGLWRDVYHRPVVQSRMYGERKRTETKELTGKINAESIATVSQAWWEEEESVEEEAGVEEEGGEEQTHSRSFPYPAEAVRLLQEPSTFAAMRKEALEVMAPIGQRKHVAGEVEVAGQAGHAATEQRDMWCWGGQNESLHIHGDWSVLHLLAPVAVPLAPPSVQQAAPQQRGIGHRVWTNCAVKACPRILQALEALDGLGGVSPQATQEGHGGGSSSSGNEHIWTGSYHVQDAWLSLVQAETHIAPHCGLTDMRLRIHLPLVVASSANTSFWLRVGRRSKCYSEGHALVFDDAFEHEVSGLQVQHLTRIYIITNCAVCHFLHLNPNHKVQQLQGPCELQDHSCPSEQQRLAQSDQAGWRVVLVIDLWHPNIM
jgi:tetratricopeptide (TPR) repeat protein